MADLSHADRYSGIVTAISVLAIVFYTEGQFDGWDLFIGCMGLLLGRKYLKAIERDDLFFVLLTAALLALSITAFICAFVQFLAPPEWLENIALNTDSLYVFLCLLAVFATIIWLRREHGAQAEPPEPDQ